jgi:cellulase
VIVITLNRAIGCKITYIRAQVLNLFSSPHSQDYATNTSQFANKVKHMYSKLLSIGPVAWLLVGLAVAVEQHPLLSTWKCTTSGGCVQQNTSIVLDKDSKYASGAAGSRTAADYAAMGVSTSGSALTLTHYVKGNPASPRVYLLGDDGKYTMMQLLGQELSVDVDYSDVPCGENGAFYLSEMAADGKGDAGAGTGYCDAQCQGYCCNEMDVLEANAKSTAMTGHPCSGNNCDKGGCAFNPYQSGQRNFWGPGQTVDTSKPFTVVTQFQANGGRLSTITRKYIQNGRQINSGSISNCGSEGSTGGLAGMGAALGRGSKSLFYLIPFLNLQTSLLSNFISTSF